MKKNKTKESTNSIIQSKAAELAEDNLIRQLGVPVSIHLEESDNSSSEDYYPQTPMKSGPFKLCLSKDRISGDCVTFSIVDEIPKTACHIGPFQEDTQPFDKALSFFSFFRFNCSYLEEESKLEEENKPAWKGWLL